MGLRSGSKWGQPAICLVRCSVATKFARPVDLPVGPSMPGLTKELTAIFICAIAGIAFIVPGFMLRLEDVRPSGSLTLFCAAK